ncbi:MAG: alanine racemase [Lactobacillales bacterium]|jgi:alanine racemase|nr:alanine racemase [Lactobacillales bacterium]
MVVGIHRPTQAIVNTQAIYHNVASEVALLDKHTELFAVVKANGYGHGAVKVAEVARKAGAKGFCVATLDEAIELREAGVVEPILILSVVSTLNIPLLLAYDLSVAVATQEWLVTASEVLSELEEKKPLKLHIKVDTGMGRIGFRSPVEVLEAVQWIEDHKPMMWEGLFTHFSTADEADDTYYHKQSKRFDEVLEVLPQLPRYVHVSNTATSLWHKKYKGNMVRFGIGIYGLNPSGKALEETYELQPALSLVSELIQVKLVPKGESIGYGATYTTTTDEWIGTIPIGYADGWIRKLQGFELLVNGKRCPIVGRVCMDQLMIRLPEEVPLNTLVTLVGKNGEEQNSLQDVADYVESIHYEVVCLLSERVPRIYI